MNAANISVTIKDKTCNAKLQKCELDDYKLQKNAKIF